MTSVAIIFDNIGPYHLARLQAAADVFDVLAVEVAGKSSVYSWEADRTEKKFRRTTLFEEGTSTGVPWAEIGRRLDAALELFQPAVVAVPGWASPAAWSALEWCTQRHVPMICMSESTAWDEPRRPWKLLVKRRLLRLFSSALVGGRLHRENLVSLGMPESRIFSGYDAVDNDYFSAAAKRCRADRDALRQRHGLPEDYFLASARFVEKKNLALMIEAYARYRKACPTAPWSLVLLGDGPLRADLERQVATLQLRSSVHLPGFRQYAELPAYYALAGAFVHASTVEPWGLVVNEAAASSLPLLVSDRCGCAPELVEAGINGFTFDPKNVDELAGKMAQIAAPGFTRRAFGEESRRIVGHWGVSRFAEGLREAVQTAQTVGPVRTDAAARALVFLLNRR